MNHCPKCNGEFEQGILADRGDYSVFVDVLSWGKKLAFWKGIEPKIKTISYRCKSCGYIEMYAKDYDNSNDPDNLIHIPKEPLS